MNEHRVKEACQRLSFRQCAIRYCRMIGAEGQSTAR